MRPNEMVVEFDERLLDFLFRNPEKAAHDDHERKQNLRNDSPQLIGKEKVLPPDNRENKEKPSSSQDENESSQSQSEEGG